VLGAAAAAVASPAHSSRRGARMCQPVGGGDGHGAVGRRRAVRGAVNGNNPSHARGPPTRSAAKTLRRMRTACTGWPSEHPGRVFRRPGRHVWARRAAFCAQAAAWMGGGICNGGGGVLSVTPSAQGSVHASPDAGHAAPDAVAARAWRRAGDRGWGWGMQCEAKADVGMGDCRHTSRVVRLHARLPRVLAMPL
jgi:hypothetical protein